MPTPLESIIAAGTKVWLDSIDPDLIRKNRAPGWGATGATSNPIIIADLIKTGRPRIDDKLTALMHRGLDDAKLAWALTDELVREAQQVFLPVWQATRGDDGYVSFELDPLLEDLAAALPHQERVRSYVELAKRWSQDQPNRMIKVPATPAGLAALEEIAAFGIPLNVTLIFTLRQYEQARDAIWRGLQRRKKQSGSGGASGGASGGKSVYSIFVSRLDVYTEKHVPELSPAAQGLVGIVNAKRIWRNNTAFWADKELSLKQEMIFASTGTKNPRISPDKYVEALTGGDIQTNPPATNDAVQALGKTYTNRLNDMPPAAVLAEIDAKVDFARLEEVLMAEGIAKFAEPQKALLELIARKRAELAVSPGSSHR